MAKLSADDIPRAVELKAGGALDKDIAAFMGVRPSTFSEWINHPANDVQAELADAIKKAEADYKNKLMASILKAGEERDWRACAWLLERKYPDEFAQTRRVAIDKGSDDNASLIRTTLEKMGYGKNNDMEVNHV